MRNQITSSPLTVSDYQMAEKFLPQNMLPLMHGDIRAVFWQEAISNGEEILVVRRITDTQSVYELINPATKKAEKLLGFNSKWPLEKGYVEYINWYKQIFSSYKV